MIRVAFLFLIREVIFNEELWHHFFLNVTPDKYKIYIHYKINKKLKYFNKYKLDNCIETSWGDRSLVDAQNLMIKEGLKDSNITHFIIVSDSCIPIKNFDYIYNILDLKYSYFDRKPVDLKQLDKKIYQFLNVHEIKKSSQWCILNRKHAYFLHNKEMIIKYFEKNNYPDERVYITALDKFGFSNEIINTCITYCKWEYKSAHPKEFELIKSSFLFNLIKSGCLFARKFKNCYVKNNKQIVNIQEFIPFIDIITTKDNNINNLKEINLIKDIGFDGNSKKYDDIIDKNNGNLFHSIQDIIENEEKKYKKLYLSKDY